MRFRQFWLPVCLLMGLYGSASAQTGAEIPYFSMNDARQAITAGLRSLPQVQCGAAPCAPATAEEIASPPIGPEDARAALIAGAKSARLEWCGSNWRDRAHAGLMMRFQSQGVYETRILALIGVIHDLQFHKDYLGLQALRTCSPDVRAALESDNPEVGVERWRRAASNALLDHSVEEMLGMVLKEIHKSRCGTAFCSPATEEELASPPLTLGEARQAMRVGLFSGAAEFCALDWERMIFLPFMAHQRNVMKRSTRQLVMVSMLHGTMQSFIVERYRTHEKICSDAMRQSLESDLSPG